VRIYDDLEIGTLMSAEPREPSAARVLPAVMRRAVGPVLLAAGGLAFAASFLTWETFSNGAAVMTGIEDGDGYFTFWLSPVLVATGLLASVWRVPRWTLGVATAASVVLLCVFRLDEVSFGRDAGTHIGIGMWLLGFASAAGLFGGAAGLMIGHSGAVPRPVG
jgi:hypothetical protein